MTFGYNIPPIPMTALCIAFLCMLLLVTFYRSRLRNVTLSARKSTSPDEFDKPLPSVSIVVYSLDNLHGLERLIPSLLDQQYDAPFEIVVVSDGKSDGTADYITRLSATHHNIYLTHVPDEAHNLSRRKLALTLGIKGARHPYIVLTSAEARIASPLWLASMTRHLTDGHDIVLGNAIIDRECDKGIGGTWRAFDRAADNAAWIASALSGHVYRGCRHNIAFKKSLFFDNKGFARSLDIHEGDDDIFIHRIAQKGLTAVELNPASLVTLDVYKAPREHRMSKVNHRFTGRRVPAGDRLTIAAGSWLIWIFFLSSAVAVATSLPDMTVTAAIAIFAIALIITLTVAWDKAVRATGDRVTPWGIVPMLIIRPFSTIRYAISERFTRSKQYTWSNPK